MSYTFMHDVQQFGARTNSMLFKVFCVWLFKSDGRWNGHKNYRKNHQFPNLLRICRQGQPATKRLFQLERKVRCLHGRQCETLHALICGIRSQPRAVTDLSVCPSACLCLSRSSLPLGKERYFLPASASFVHREASSRDAM